MNFHKKNENTENNAVQTETSETAKVTRKKGGFKSFLKSRKAKHGSVAVVIVAVVVALTILLNIVCSLLVERFPALSLDLTSNQVFALQEDSRDYLSHLEKDITIYVLADKDTFTSNGSYFVQAEKLLNNMKSTSSHIKLEYVDLSKTPTFTSKYEKVDWTQKTHVLLVESESDYRVLDIDDCFEYDQQTYAYYGSYSFTGSKVEQAVITAILNVTTEDKAIVNFITGNSEVDYSNLKDLLESNAYQVDEVSLTTSDLNQDAKVAILFAPAVDLDPSAVEKLENWLESDGDYGKSLIYVANYELENTPNLDEFLNKWGIKMSNGIVFESDPNFLISNLPFISLTNYNDVFTQDLKNASIPCLSSYARGVEITDEEKATPVLTTSSSACILPYSEKDNADWNYQSAITGEPINIAVKGTLKNTDEVASNVVVFGSYNMFSESYMYYNSYNNSAFFTNTVNTLADRDSIGITIEGKSMDAATLGIDLAGQNTLMVLFVIIVPIAVLVAGLLIWLRRRNK